jgi:hypothetical protein
VVWRPISGFRRTQTHPSFFKSNCIEDEEKKRDFKIQLKQLLSDTVSPVSHKNSASLTEDFLNFCLSDLAKQDGVDFF